MISDDMGSGGRLRLVVRRDDVTRRPVFFIFFRTGTKPNQPHPKTRRGSPVFFIYSLVLRSCMVIRAVSGCRRPGLETDCHFRCPLLLLVYPMLHFFTLLIAYTERTCVIGTIAYSTVECLHVHMVANSQCDILSPDWGARLFFSASIIALTCDLTSCLLLLCLQRWASASYHGQSEEVRQTQKMQTAAITRNESERIDQKALFVKPNRWSFV
jgi:hypothetical protein